MEETKLNQRQKDLYEFIRKQSAEGKKSSCFDILWNPLLGLEYKDFRDYKRVIRLDVEIIDRMASGAHMPILSDCEGYFIAQDDVEFQRWAIKRKKVLLHMLSEFNQKCKKNSLNEQIIIVFEKYSQDEDVFKSQVKRKLVADPTDNL
jgi:hypothetical protein